MALKKHVGGQRVCAGIRTHQFGQAEEALYRRLRECFSKEDIFVVVDETRQHVDIPSGYQKVSLSKRFLNQNELFSDFGRIGWLCGDYFYYVLRQENNADAYWLIEPDVRFTFASMEEFFFDESYRQVDLAAPLFRKMGPKWGWYKNALRIAPEVYGCAFPVTRLSANAIDQLLPERRRISDEMNVQSLSWREYPNDESFTATGAMRLGMACSALVGEEAGLLSHFSTKFPYCWDSTSKYFPPNRIVHPALGKEDFVKVLEKKVRGVLNRSELKALIAIALTGLDEPDIVSVRETISKSISAWLRIAVAGPQ